MPASTQQEDEDGAPTDFIGRAEVSLDPLYHDQTINKKLIIYNYKNKNIGSLVVKINWGGHQKPYKHEIGNAEMTRKWEKDLTERIAKAI
jgi:hypothetical protein